MAGQRLGFSVKMAKFSTTTGHVRSVHHPVTTPKPAMERLVSRLGGSPSLAQVASSLTPRAKQEPAQISGSAYALPDNTQEEREQFSPWQLSGTSIN
jgi:hypothetical protein